MGTEFENLSNQYFNQWMSNVTKIMENLTVSTKAHDNSIKTLLEVVASQGEQIAFLIEVVSRLVQETKSP